MKGCAMSRPGLLCFLAGLVAGWIAHSATADWPSVQEQVALEDFSGSHRKLTDEERQQELMRKQFRDWVEKFEACRRCPGGAF
jgi:hypothetical protein